MVQRRGKKQRDQASPVDAAGDDPPWIGGADREIEHPRKASDAQDHAGAVADRVDKFLRQGVLRLGVMHGDLSKSCFVAHCKRDRRDKRLSEYLTSIRRDRTVACRRRPFLTPVQASARGRQRTLPRRQIAAI